MHYNGEARPGGGIATPVDGCDRQFRRRARVHHYTVLRPSVPALSSGDGLRSRCLERRAVSKGVHTLVARHESVATRSKDSLRIRAAKSRGARVPDGDVVVCAQSRYGERAWSAGSDR